MILKKEQGFTILETLVAINLSFIVVTAVAAFYLFMVKYISSSSAGLYSRISDDTALNLLSDILYKSDSFTINLSRDSITINGEKKLISFSEDHISVGNLYYIRNLKLNSFIISLQEKDKITWQSGMNQGFYNEDLTLHSSSINDFYFEFEKKNKKTEFIYYQPPVSIKKFTNVEGIAE